MTKQCHRTGSKSYHKAVWLSILLGGLAADRFYLGHIGMGFFKLLSFGGFGLWTLIDVAFIMCRYLTPADGSDYNDA
jgi:TM2 domain-containing membrane protein YozV